MKKYRYIKIIYSAKTNPEVMGFQLLVRNYSLQLKKYDIKVKYIKNRLVPFRAELYDRHNKKHYETNDYRRLKYMIRKVGFFKDEYKSKATSKKTRKTKSKAHRKKKNSKKARKTKSKGGGMPFKKTVGIDRKKSKGGGMTFKKTVGIDRKKLRGGGPRKRFCFVCGCDNVKNNISTVITKKDISNTKIPAEYHPYVNFLWNARTDSKYFWDRYKYLPLYGQFRYICKGCYHGNTDSC